MEGTLISASVVPYHDMKLTHSILFMLKVAHKVSTRDRHKNFHKRGCWSAAPVLVMVSHGTEIGENVGV